MLIKKPDLTFLNSLRKTKLATLQAEIESSKVQLSVRLLVEISGLYLLDSNQISERLRFLPAPWDEIYSTQRTPLLFFQKCCGLQMIRPEEYAL